MSAPLAPPSRDFVAPPVGSELDGSAGFRKNLRHLRHLRMISAKS
jgi:hypothetical protein